MMRYDAGYWYFYHPAAAGYADLLRAGHQRCNLSHDDLGRFHAHRPGQDRCCDPELQFPCGAVFPDRRQRDVCCRYYGPPDHSGKNADGTYDRRSGTGLCHAECLDGRYLWFCRGRCLYGVSCIGPFHAEGGLQQRLYRRYPQLRRSDHCYDPAQCRSDHVRICGQCLHRQTVRCRHCSRHPDDHRAYDRRSHRL